MPVGEVEVERACRARGTHRGARRGDALSALERVCLHGRVWLVRDRDTTAVAAPLRRAGDGAAPDCPDLGGDFPYHDTIDWQAIRGSMRTAGPGLVWARPRLPLVAGEAMRGLQRVVLIGDSASGISAELDWDEWSFVNIDLDVHLSRPVEGDWVLIDAVTDARRGR